MLIICVSLGVYFGVWVLLDVFLAYRIGRTGDKDFSAYRARRRLGFWPILIPGAMLEIVGDYIEALGKKHKGE